MASLGRKQLLIKKTKERKAMKNKKFKKMGEKIIAKFKGAIKKLEKEQANWKETQTNTEEGVIKPGTPPRVTPHVRSGTKVTTNCLGAETIQGGTKVRRKHVKK